MTWKDIQEIIQYIVHKGLLALEGSSAQDKSPIDFVSIFSKDDLEFNQLTEAIEPRAKKIKSDTGITGITYLLSTSIQTEAGELKIVRIRKPDPTRPQRGAPDFRVPDYKSFKEECLNKNSGNYTILMRKGFELVEIKGINVLVYVPNVPISEELGL